MPETKPIYSTNQETIVNKAYTVAIKHVGMISDLVARKVGRNDSEIVRQAIEFYYFQMQNNPQDDGHES